MSARVQEEIEFLREVLAFAFEASLMAGQAQQNAVTRKLAAWAAILAVPTAIAGIYGMNFEHIGRDAARRPQAHGGPHALRAGRGLRRHRHQPALHLPGTASARSPGLPPGARQHPRRPVADLLVADDLVTLKYVMVVMRADNRGEGGVLALMALVARGPALARAGNVAISCWVCPAPRSSMATA